MQKSSEKAKEIIKLIIYNNKSYKNLHVSYREILKKLFKNFIGYIRTKDKF